MLEALGGFIVEADKYLVEGLLLLTALTPSSPDLQKLVAFENAFDRIFAIIDVEGSLTHGGIAVQDCLSLLANLLRLNVSNQSYFRETGWIKKLANLLSDAIRDQDLPDGVAEWARPQRDKNVWGLLAVLRLFLLKGSAGTQANQLSFWQSGVLTQVLDITFRDSFDIPIRAEVSKIGRFVRSGNALTRFEGPCNCCRSHPVQQRATGGLRSARSPFPAASGNSPSEWSYFKGTAANHCERDIWTS